MVVVLVLVLEVAQQGLGERHIHHLRRLGQRQANHTHPQLGLQVHHNCLVQRQLEHRIGPVVLRLFELMLGELPRYQGNHLAPAQ
jgi:hypothetical protein